MNVVHTQNVPLEKAAPGSGHHVCITTVKGVPATQLPESLREGADWQMMGMALEEVARMRPEDETKEGVQWYTRAGLKITRQMFRNSASQLTSHR